MATVSIWSVVTVDEVVEKVKGNSTTSSTVTTDQILTVVTVDEVVEKVKGNSTKGPYTDKCYQSVGYGLV